MPSLMSTTRMAMSARLPPLFLKFVKAACPGVSIITKPGIFICNLCFSSRFPQIFFIVAIGIREQPML